MSKDVRIEILYYKESTDVSLEFGLHGDYPVRMLSTSCDDIESDACDRDWMILP